MTLLAFTFRLVTYTHSYNIMVAGTDFPVNIARKQLHVIIRVFTCGAYVHIYVYMHERMIVYLPQSIPNHARVTFPVPAQWTMNHA